MADPLKKYRSMRSFDDTPEPAGAKLKKKTRLPIFVIQKHDASHLHYDFRLEMEGVLKSWAVPKGPSYDPSVKRLAMMTEDHPYDYASFEGVIPEGNYGAGNVIIWDNGGWEFIEPGDDPVKALRSGKITFRMYGKKMFGEWALVKIHGRSPKGNEWLLLKHRDEFANEEVDVTKVAPRSVVSNRLVDEVDPSKQWKSNREPSATGKAVTVGSRLKPAKASKAKAAKKTSKSTTRAKASTRSRSTKAKKAPAKASTRSRRAPSQPRSKPSRGASSPSRSSRAARPQTDRPTRRRRPR